MAQLSDAKRRREHSHAGHGKEKSNICLLTCDPKYQCASQVLDSRAAEKHALRLDPRCSKCFIP